MKQGPSFAAKKGTLIALACGAAFAAPYAAAQLKTEGHALTLQGSIAGGVGRIKASGATLGPANDTVARTVITTGESNIRFSASQKLSGSFFQGIGFQVESGVNMDSGGSSSSAGVLGQRNTGIGVGTSIGKFWTGKWDTAYKEATFASVTASGTGVSGSDSGLYGNPGLTSGTGGQANGMVTGVGDNMSFRRRHTNTLNYWSPEFSNFFVNITYSPDENTGTGDAPAPSARTSLWSVGIDYEDGPFHGTLAWEQHNDFLWGGTILNSTGSPQAGAFGAGSANWGAGTQSKDTAIALSLGYKFGNTEIRGMYERLKWTQSGGTAVLTDLSSDHWYLGVIQKLGGPHRIIASYGVAQDYDCNPSAICGTDTGMRTWKLAYSYQLDKTSWLNVFYGRLDNDRNGNYGIAGGVGTVGISGATGATTNPAGISYQGYSVTLDTRF